MKNGLTGIKKGGIFMGFTLCLIFLLYPTKIKGKRLLWYDGLLAILGLASGLYTYLVTDRFSLSNLKMTDMDFAMSVIAVALVILAARRAVGNSMAILPILFALYAIYGKYISGLLGHNGYSVRRFFMRMYMVDEGLYGMTTQVATSYVFLFIVFGSFLASSGVAEFFTDAANHIAGARAGGPAKVAVISSGLMGTISGSSAANVATTGAFTIPPDEEGGLHPGICRRSRGHRLHRRNDHAPHHGLGRLPDDAVFGGSLQFDHASRHHTGAPLLLLGSYVGPLYGAENRESGNAQGGYPAHSGLGPAHFAFAPPGCNHHLPPHRLYRDLRSLYWDPGHHSGRLPPKGPADAAEDPGALINGAKSSLTSMIACIVAGIIVGVCNLTGLGQVITYNITQISGNNLLFALLLTALCCIILSMGLPAAACYILVATIVAPALVRMGVTPMAAHMFVFIFSCYSNITPPVAIASFTAAGLAGARPFDVAMQGLKIAAPGFIIPFMFVYNPALLLEGAAPAELMITVVTATLGVLFLAISGAGYSFGQRQR